MAISYPLIFLGVLSAGLAVAMIVLAVNLSEANKYSSNLEAQLAAIKEEATTPGTTPATTVAPATTTQGPTEPWEREYRLPTDTLPEHYEILLHPNLETGNFSGKVDIHLNVTSARNFLLVHTKYITIKSAVLRRGRGDANGQITNISQHFEYPRNEFWVFKLGTQITPDAYTLYLEFDGSLTRDIVGFYKSTYYDAPTNTSRMIATSKFQPTYARRAFPCLDEPSYKSTYGVTLVRPTGQNYVAFSNMPETSATDNSPSTGLTTVKFQKSVPMVTYLACFIVCDFQARKDFTKRGVPIQVISRSSQFNSTVYPLEVGVKVTDYFEEYFNISYVLPKQDLIAIPDFVSGAMEHWGLITFRETALLYNERENAISNKKRVATVVAHELAHQWFGNLMTVSWWDDLWLNEGFASYVEYKGVAAAEPNWDFETFILPDDVGPVFKLDGKLSSHPIVVPVNHPDEITEIFDTISYSKGASVLMMLENFMGAEPFRKGISNFLKEYTYANAATADLWAELQKERQDLNIARIMDTWTRQMGFPVLTYTVNGNQLTVQQSRFLSDPNANGTVAPSPFNYKWDVPIFYRTDKSTVEGKWLYLENNTVTIDLPTGFTWVKLNTGQHGYYRVNYLPAHWTALATALIANANAMSASDRWGVVEDSFSLAAAGSLPYSTALDLVQYIKKDRHPVPWSSASSNIGTIRELVYNTNVYPGFRKLIVSLVEDPFNDLTWNDTGSFLDINLRSTILSMACSSDYAPCLDGAADRFRKWIATREFIPPNFRMYVYRYGISQIGDATAWNELWSRYTKEDDPAEAIKLLYGLAFPKEPWLIQQLLELAKTGVRSQDYFTVLEYVAVNPIGLPIVWDFIRTEWNYLVDRFTTNNRYLGNMVRSVTSRFTTQIRLDEMREFFAKYPDAGAGARARLQALETVENNINWLKTNKPGLESWLKAHNFM